jgi:hypothetical protein
MDDNDYQTAPDPDNKTKLKLWVQAGGRCSFPGCNDYLLHDDVSLHDDKHGRISHIVGKSNSPHSPRGLDPMPIERRSEIDNLILLCGKHHDLVDKDEPDRYPAEVLREYKRQHEERIFHLTSMAADQKTTVIWFRTVINGELVNGKMSDLYEALWRRGRYPADPHGILVDLTQHPDGQTEAFYQFAVEQIDAKTEILYTRNLAGSDIRHLSVFAIGPIPLLIYLGHKLSNKIPTELYQRHRDTEDWCWKDAPSEAEYSFSLIQEGSDPARVALILSLSGQIDPGTLPSHIDQRFFTYEISLQNMVPIPTYLRTPNDLEGFKATYYQFWAQVRAMHPKVDTIHLFPAIPTPIAVLCGREVLKKVDASLTVYDNRKDSGGFVKVLEVG